jgi:hypothetical protein
VGSFTLAQWGKALPKIGKDIERAAMRGLYSAALRAKGIVVEEIDHADPYPAVNRGQLRQSVQVTKITGGWLVVVDAPHAAIIEHGTRPFWPPLAPLIEWVTRKGFVRSMGDPAEHEREVVKLARAVQWSIAARGIAPRHYFAKAMARMKPIVPQEIQRELDALRG